MRVADSRAAEAGIFRRAFVFMVSLFGAFWSNLKAGLLTVAGNLGPDLAAHDAVAGGLVGRLGEFVQQGLRAGLDRPGAGFVATVLFMLAMTYVPVAQARLAAAGTWRSFFDYRLVRALVTGRPVSVLKLTIYMVIAGLVIALYRMAPLAIGNYFDAVAICPSAASWRSSSGSMAWARCLPLRCSSGSGLPRQRFMPAPCCMRCAAAGSGPTG